MSITVFTARAVRTMNPSQPTATAVAVRDDRIVDVGSLDTLRPWLDAHPHRIDDRFADHVLLPGFIDPHLHPSMAAVLLPMHFITAMEWQLPWQTAPAIRGAEAYTTRLVEIEGGLNDPSEPLITWGYHHIWHGPMDRALLNAISASRPVIAWHRSFHELYMNDAALAWLGIAEADAGKHPQVDIARGRFFETGLKYAVARMNRYLLAPDRFRAGLQRLREVVAYGGHTTIGDMATGIFDLDMEWSALVDVLERDDTPFRVHMVPHVGMLHSAAGDDDAAVEKVRRLVDRNTHRLRFGDHVKLFTDGAFFSELMQLGPPGYIDGHHGEWMMVPDRFEALARLYWRAGYKIHVHCTGDLGVDLALDVLERLQIDQPRPDHRFTIEHFGLSTPEQARRIATLGAQVSANVYYLYELADAYWRHSIGYERASQMSRLGALARHGVPLALHSDFTMAPALPLNSAWIAANRINEAGDVMAPEERLTLDQALRAITIDAAYMLGMENDIGSIRAGKKADFTVLAADPYETPVADLKDIPILGTVFEGTPFPRPA